MRLIIFQLNSLPGKILFLAPDWDFFFGNWGKRRIFWIGNGAYIQPLVIGRKGPEDPTLFIFLKGSTIYSIITLYENFKVISNYLITFLK